MSINISNEQASIPLKILGMGKYLPSRVMLSSTLEAQMGLKPGWILQKSGVEERRWAEHESNAELGAQALTEALENAGLAYEELDLIINASGSYDYPIPDTSCLIQRAMGKGRSGIPSFTVDATCLSFIAALEVAASFLASGRYRRIAIVSAEIASRSLNLEEKETATLLGDGAAAAIVGIAPAEETSALLQSRLETYGDGAMYTYVKGGGNVLHPNAGGHPSDFTFHMDGPKVLGMAFKQLRPFLKALFRPLGFGLRDCEFIVPHQASKGAIDTARRLFRWRENQYIDHLATHGNCIAASIPMALYDAISQNRIARGDRVCLLGTGAGLSVGGLVLVY
jgi:3-oxoacyl-[acyl-carrier-protein] synthase III